MEVSYYLKRVSSKTPTVIFARISYGGNQVKYYLPESIHPSFWNKTTQRARESYRFPEYPEFNVRLDKIQSRIKSVIRQYVNDNSLAYPDPLNLKLLLDAEIKGNVREKRGMCLLDFFKTIIDDSRNSLRLNPKTGKPISPNTIKTYSTTFEHLMRFQQKYKILVDFSTIDMQFYSQYTSFLIKEYKLSTNSIGKDIQILKLVMSEASEHGYTTNLAFKGKRFITVREKADTVYLNRNELEAIIALDLSDRPKLDRARDSFIIGCYTGLRFSDFSTFNPSQIRDGLIEITQTKTNDPVVIPVHSNVEAIIKKYSGQLPKALSNQKLNNYIKEVAALIPELNSTVETRYTKAGQKQVMISRKSELVTTHTARRSFATNEFLEGTPALTIMSITGHKTEKAFLKYIRVTPSEHAQLLKKTWEKRKSN